VLALLAHGLLPDGHGSIALSILMLLGMIIPFLILGGVCWVFLKAKRREEAELAREAEWRNARSS
jgi:protein-S-isoprenylcysteine O-methyltransferase Ste14